MPATRCVCYLCASCFLKNHFLQIINEDHCSSCRSHGALVYCDGCPRAFHLWCLNPPMENIDEGDSRWFCPACVIRKVKSLIEYVFSMSSSALAPTTKATTLPVFSPHPPGANHYPHGISATGRGQNILQRRFVPFSRLPHMALTLTDPR